MLKRRWMARISGWRLGKLGMAVHDSSRDASDDGLFDAANLEHVEISEPVPDANAGVNKRFRAFVPNQVMLVPPSLDEWLPENHLSRFIAELVDTELDLSRFYASYGNAKGFPPYDPRLMVRVLLYGYCVGVRSSRELERACSDVVAFRWLSAQQFPDFRSFARFRKRHLAALGNVFLQALELCRAAGMLSLGQIALDGTKVRANASRRKAMSYARLSEKQKVLAQEVSDLLAEAERIDAGEDARFGASRGDELPAELARREGRLEKITAAKEQLEAEAAERARAAAEQQAREDGEDDEGVKTKGQEAAKGATVKPTAQRNFTDPDARIMKTADGSFHYSYTAQAIVDGDCQVIVATELTNIAVDVQQMIPMLKLLEETIHTTPGEVLIDAGYCSTSNLQHAQDVEDATGGATRFFIATGRMKHSDAVPETVTGPPREGASLKEQMAHRLKTQAGKTAYARRKAIVEPVFGQIHTRQGKHLLLRSLEQAKAEWSLIAGCHNLMKLFSHRTAIAATAG